MRLKQISVTLRRDRLNVTPAITVAAGRVGGVSFAVPDMFVKQVTKLLSKVVLKIFFRRVEVVGQEDIPRDGPIVYVANHFNSLVDPLLVLGFLPRHARFLATSVLWDNPMLKPFLRLGRVIPVYRRQDPGFSEDKNEETFGVCYEVLGDGEAIALFPEGRSHDEPELQPMKTGAARIALGAERKFPELGVRIVPVGLTFDAKDQFRSRALIEVGRPIGPISEARGADPDDRDAVNRLTARIGDGLESVTLSYPSWEEAYLINRAAQIYGRAETPAPTRRKLSAEFSIRKLFVEGYRDLKALDPERVASITRAVETYDRMLKITSLRHEQVMARYPIAVVVIYALKTLSLLLVRLPLALVGTVLNIVPFIVARTVGTFDVGRMDRRATRAVFAGIVAFPIMWLIAGVWAGIAWGTTWGWVVGLLAPVTGMSALRFLEGRRQLVDEARAYLLLRSHDRMKAELRARYETLAVEVSRLIDLYMSFKGSESANDDELRSR